jgi:hypothetical protein
MSRRTIRSIVTFLALALVSAIIAFAQSAISVEVPIATASNTWQFAQAISSSKRKLFVVTFDQPNRRQTCHVQSFTQDKLVCSRAIGGPRTWPPKQVVALILPGDDELRLRVILGLNGGMGAAIWGTVVLAAACPACAVATGIAAFLLFGAAGAILISDDQPDRLLYLAPGQKLSGKLGFVQR